MALALGPTNVNKGGLIRVILNRGGDVEIPGFIDISHMYRANYQFRNHWKIGSPLKIKNTDEILETIQPDRTRLIGFEDPDILTSKNSFDVYFTIPFLSTRIGKAGWLDSRVYLGHAKGKSLDSLTMKEPVLSSILCTNSQGQQFSRGFKELCPAPINNQGFSYHLVESHDLVNNIDYSTIAVVKAVTNDGPWEFIDDVIHPAYLKEQYSNLSKQFPDAYDWCGEHASPCRLLPKTFVDGGKYLVGIMNGRSPKTKNGYGRFLPGLFLYDANTGEVVWVDPQPLFDDLSARTIVFASEFIAPSDDNSYGTLLAHIDDSRIYSYKITSKTIRNRLPTELLQ